MVKSALLRWVGVVLTVLALALGTGTATAVATTTDAPWRVAATLSLGTEGTAVACPTATTCWAIEAAQLLSSTDGGLTWATRTARVPAAVDNLVDLACPTASTCYATATNADGTQALLTLRTAGRSIGSLPVPAPAPLTELSCAGPLHCMASDGASGYVTLDGGLTWTSHLLQKRFPGEFGLTCRPGTTTCFAVGESFSSGVAFRTDDDGATWVYQPVPSAMAALYDVTCPTADTCYAGGALFPSGAGGLVRTTDGGATWSLISGPQSFPVRSISCLTATTCVATGEMAFALRTSDGTTWTTSDLGTGSSSRDKQVACTGTARCVVVTGGSVSLSPDAGATWSRADLVAGLEAPAALSCPAPGTTCVGVGVDGFDRPQSLTSKDDGTTWTSHPFPAGAGYPTDVDCPSVSLCFATMRYDVPGTPRVVSQTYRSTDGGGTWKAGRVASAGGAFTDLSCVSTTTCMALGWGSRSSTKLGLTTDGGRSWKVVTPPVTTDYYSTGLSCRASTGCVILTHGSAFSAPTTAWTSGDLGATWQGHLLPVGEYFDVDCSGSTCLAVGGKDNNQRVARSDDGGATWTATSIPGNTLTAFEVACGSPTSCVMSGDDSISTGVVAVRTTQDGGATWTAHAVPARNETAFALACRSSTCWAADYSVNGRPQVYTNAP